LPEAAGGAGEQQLWVELDRHGSVVGARER